VIAIVPHTEGAIVSVVAQPGSKRNAVLGERAEAVRISVTAPPDKGKANAAIQAVLAENLGCKTAQVSLISGATSRQKRFLIRGLDPEELRKRLDSVLIPMANRKQPAENNERSDP
jgi:uncharacterized protein